MGELPPTSPYLLPLMAKHKEWITTVLVVVVRVGSHLHHSRQFNQLCRLLIYNICTTVNSSGVSENAWIQGRKYYNHSSAF